MFPSASPGERGQGERGPREGGPHRPAPTRSRWWRRLPWSPPRIVGVYAVVGILWIAFSDRLVERLVADPELRGRLQTVKGAAFVVLTSVLLLELTRRGDRGLRSLGGELRATVDSMADAVLLVDRQHRIVEANRAAVALLGVADKGEILGSLAAWGERFALRSPDGTPVPFPSYASVRALRGERIAGYDAVLRRADGRDVFVSVSAAPVEDGRPAGLAVAVLRDVSAGRRLDEIREEFLATAAHELKTPLAVIKAYAQLVQKRAPAEAQALVVVQRQVDRLDRLVQHLLDTSRLRLEPAEDARQRFDLAELARQVLDAARPAAPAHALSMVAPAPALVDAERDRIARVLSSLVENAVRFSPRGGPVEVRVEAVGGEAVASIRDRGLGIPAERQGRIFERFYRAHAGTPEDHGGLGLGLEVSREIVARHRGRMWFESAPGEGSTFHFSLPLAPGEVA